VSLMTIVAEGTKMLELIFIHTFVVFAITLTLTKADILACKRSFVEERYDYVIQNNQKPCFLHTLWYKIFTCPMCCGFWVALFSSFFIFPEHFMISTLSAYGLNWLLHCGEEALYKYSNRSSS